MDVDIGTLIKEYGPWIGMLYLLTREWGPKILDAISIERRAAIKRAEHERERQIAIEDEERKLERELKLEQAHVLKQIGSQMTSISAILQQVESILARQGDRLDRIERDVAILGDRRSRGAARGDTQ